MTNNFVQIARRICRTFCAKPIPIFLMGCYNQNSDTPNSKNGGYHMKHTKKLLSLLLVLCLILSLS